MCFSMLQSSIVLSFPHNDIQESDDVTFPKKKKKKKKKYIYIYIYIYIYMRVCVYTPFIKL